jgi:hypothetical protein
MYTNAQMRGGLEVNSASTTLWGVEEKWEGVQLGTPA